MQIMGISKHHCMVLNLFLTMLSMANSTYATDNCPTETHYINENSDCTPCGYCQHTGSGCQQGSGACPQGTCQQWYGPEPKCDEYIRGSAPDLVFQTGPWLTYTGPAEVFIDYAQVPGINQQLTNYYVYRAQIAEWSEVEFTEKDTDIIHLSVSGNIAYEFHGLEPNTRYKARMALYRRQGEQYDRIAVSNFVSGKTICAAPARPDIGTVKQSGPDSIILQWKNFESHCNYVESAQLEYTPSGSVFKQAVILTTSTHINETVVAGLQLGIQYQFKIILTNDVNKETEGNIVTFTLQDNYESCLHPTTTTLTSEAVSCRSPACISLAVVCACALLCCGLLFCLWLRDRRLRLGSMPENKVIYSVKRENESSPSEKNQNVPNIRRPPMSLPNERESLYDTLHPEKSTPPKYTPITRPEKNTPMSRPMDYSYVEDPGNCLQPQNYCAQTFGKEYRPYITPIASEEESSSEKQVDNDSENAPRMSTASNASSLGYLKPSCDSLC